MNASRLLIVKMSSIGDVVMSLPAFDALRRRFPSAHIAWLIDPQCREIVEGCDGLDEIIVNPTPNSKTFRARHLVSRQMWRDARGLTRALRERQFDVAIDLQGLFRSAIWCWLARAPLRVGLTTATKEFNHIFLNCRVPPLGDHYVDRFLGVAAHFGADVSQPRFCYTIPAAAHQFAEDFLREHALVGNGRRAVPLVGINPGASQWVNRWGTEKFARVADALMDEGAHVILFGGPSDAPIVQQVHSAIRHPPVVAAGRTSLSQCAALLSRCDTLITGDTGPMHIAAAIGTPVVAIFGPADPKQTGPYGANHTVLSTALPCQPCYRKPVACKGRIDCLKLITVEEVVSKTLDLLNSRLKT